MDLIIKNLEKLQDYHTKEGKHPIERLVLDFDKLSEMKDFTKIFEKSCEKYNEEAEGECSICGKCKHQFVWGYEEPCRSCLKSKEISPNWEPKEPSLKEVTERMQSEFDATGKDVKIFMNERVIKR